MESCKLFSRGEIIPGSEDVTVTKLTHPDIPFIVWHLPINNNQFDLAMNGGKR